MKDLVIGVYTKYDFAALKPWVRSLKASGFSGDIVVLALDADEETPAALEAEGVTVVKLKNVLEKHHIVTSRFMYIYDYLIKNPNYRYVLTVDMRDAIFQTNPSDFMEKALQDKNIKIIASTEPIHLKNEPWSRAMMQKQYGEYYARLFESNIIYCAGVIAGTSDYLRDLCLSIFNMARAYISFGVDQTAYAMLLYNHPWRDITLSTTDKDAWAANVYVSYRKDKYPYHLYLTDPRPTMENGIVKNAAGEPFVIVHQYDRIPEWTEYYTQKYKDPIIS